MPPRYFQNDAEPSRRDPYKQLIASLTRLVTKYPPQDVPPGGGLYYGPTSIAFLFWCLSEHYKDLEIDEVPMGTWFMGYLKTSQDAMKDFVPPDSQHCGVQDDIMSLIALTAATSKDSEMARELCDFAHTVTKENANNEWLYGRAGYLYLLRLARASFIDDKETQDMIDDAADEVIEAILQSPRPWKWHNKNYVGAVHGTIGIITQIVLTDHRYASELEPELGAVLSYQYESGNWPSSLPPGKDRLVQFCHGAPGVVSSLVSIKQYFPKLEDRIDKAIDRGRQAIKERGLLTKEPCLCHGISGNALALEGADFEHFLTFTTKNEMRSMDKDGMMEKSDDPSSLWTGEAGRAWAWAVADRGIEKKYIGYNDI